MIEIPARVRISIFPFMGVRFLTATFTIFISSIIGASYLHASEETHQFSQAFPGDNYDLKKEVLQQLGNPAVGSDNEVLPLLVAAVGDRQAYSDAIAALRRRTGLTPPAFQGQSHYPQYPPSDSPASWQYWLADRQRALVQEAQINHAISETHSAIKAAQEADVAVSQSPTNADAHDAHE